MRYSSWILMVNIVAVVKTKTFTNYSICLYLLYRCDDSSRRVIPQYIDRVFNLSFFIFFRIFAASKTVCKKKFQLHSCRCAQHIWNKFGLDMPISQFVVIFSQKFVQNHTLKLCAIIFHFHIRRSAFIHKNEAFNSMM